MRLAIFAYMVHHLRRRCSKVGSLRGRHVAVRLGDRTEHADREPLAEHHQVSVAGSATHGTQTR